VFGDGARLQQVVWNLLSNAVKFTSRGGSVHLNVSQLHETIELSVTDTGEGIGREFLPVIFEPFLQADSSSTRSRRGLGLGLAIVRSLVEAHNGQIAADSAGPGTGATFTVRLPSAGVGPDVVAPRATGAPPVTAAESDGVLALSGVTILLVDDDQDSRDVVAEQLRLSGGTVAVATSAREALDIIVSRHVDVLVADINMPVEDGYSLIRRIRGLTVREAAAVPAAALTALARPEDRRMALQAGFQLHLAKPVDPVALTTALVSLHRLKAM
jgi:CheY-like chemotaxis protein